MSYPEGMRRLIGGLACVLALGLGVATAEISLRGAETPDEPVEPAVAPPSYLTQGYRRPRARRANQPRHTRGRVEVGAAAPEADRTSPVAPHLAHGRLIRGGTPHRMVLFTFDDGPDRRTTPRLLAELDRLDVKATFFVTTNRIEGPGSRRAAQAELLREIVRRGHTVGNHTADHEQLTLLSHRDAREQVVRAERAIENVIGERPWLFRPPYGARSSRIDHMLVDRGYTTVLWNIGSGDFQVEDADSVFETWRRVLARVEREDGERGGIVLMHDTHPWTVRALPMIVDWIRARNCELLETDEELFDIVGDPALFYSARVDGDGWSAEAPPAILPPDVVRERQARVRRDAERRCADRAPSN